MKLTDLMLQRIKDEIELDPDNIGYLGKTDDEIAVLLNTSVKKIRIVEEGFPPPISRIWTAIPETPNLVTKDDVTAAKAVKVV